jgi:predicted kinase
MKKTLIVMRSASGAGKSSFVELLKESNPSAISCSADKFFIDKDGSYNFDVTKLGQAHKSCQLQFDAALIDEKINLIILDNTNTKPSDWKYYEDKAREAGLRVVFVVLENRHGGVNVHNVPDEVLERQANTIKQNLKLL